MDPELQNMTVRLSELALRTTAAGVYDRINARKARRNDAETINDLEEIINELLQEKQELVRISTAMSDRLQASRMSDEDIAYVTDVFIPKLSELANSMGGDQARQLEQVVEQVTPLISREMLTMMQLLGFDFRRSIGEPLTDLLAAWIQSRMPPDSGLQRAQLERETAYLQVVADEEAHARLQGR